MLLIKKLIFLILIGCLIINAVDADSIVKRMWRKLTFSNDDEDVDNILSYAEPERNEGNVVINITERGSLWNPLNWFKRAGTSVPISYNPDVDLTTCELAVRHGYQCESHIVKTDDGYLLTVHRIPCGRKGCGGDRGMGQPVFLQHGLLASSADWLLSGPSKALGFILSDAGYDVWMGNARGNTYSKRHTSYDNDDSEFWAFSWHEMAVHDVPAEIDYIYETKYGNETSLYNLLYIGHSMGTTMAFAMLSERPEYNEKIQAVFALAPVAYMTHIKSPIRLLAPFSGNIQLLIRLFGANQFLPQNRIIKYLAKYGCELTEAERYICENTVFVLCGFDKPEYNETLMPIIFGHTPAGTSTRTVVHFAQEIHEHGNFQQFDYGKTENQKRYGCEKPPLYNISQIQTPIGLFYARNDWLAGKEDVVKLHQALQNNSMELYEVPFESFNHVDFLWGKDAPEFVYKRLMELMENYN